MKVQCFARILALVIVATCSACASWPKAMELRSEPAGAELYSQSGQKLGVTPLILENEILNQVAKDGFAHVEVRKSGFESRTLILDLTRGGGQVDLKLRQMNDTHFRDVASKEYLTDINLVTRELLRIQGYIVVSRLDEADRMLEKFQEKYPLVAAGFVLRASLALKKNKKDMAISNLLKAQSLDPQDKVVTQMLQALGRSPATAGQP